jgi:hypothetical protein
MVDLRKHAVNQFAKQTFNKAKESIGIDGGPSSQEEN